MSKTLESKIEALCEQVEQFEKLSPGEKLIKIQDYATMKQEVNKHKKSIEALQLRLRNPAEYDSRTAIDINSDDENAFAQRIQRIEALKNGHNRTLNQLVDDYIEITALVARCRCDVADKLDVIEI